jgi:cobalt/nickel transport system permease protein
MLHDYLDHHRRLESPIHKLPAASKLAASLAVVAAAVASPLPRAWPALGALLLLLAAAAAASKLPRAFLARRLLLLEPFALGAAALALLRPGGTVIFLGVLAKSTLCLLAMLLLAATTPFSETLEALRRWRVPLLLVSVVALMYRYLFVLLDEAERMSRARASRSFAADRLRTWRSSASIIGGLFVRSARRAERIYAAMWARGWG